MITTDTYNVINKTIITDLDKKIIIDLYQPIIGYNAISLYFSLLNDLDKTNIISQELFFNHLINNMQISINEIKSSIERLEAIGLIATYLKKGEINNYLFNIYSPLSAEEFFNNPILNMILYSNIGKEEYEIKVAYYKTPKISTKDYENITHRFDEVFQSTPSNIYMMYEDIRTRQSNKMVFTNYDFELLQSGINNFDAEKWLTDTNKELIINLSVLYNIDVLNMQNMLMSSINSKGLIDKELLRKNCRNYYQFEQDGNLPTLIYKKQPSYLKSNVSDKSKRSKMIYTFENINPYNFIKSKYKDGKVTTRDLKIIEDLLIDQKLNPGVVNVLIDYVLKINNQKLNKNYIEAIAGHWKRLDIKTVTQAMEQCEKEHSKINKKVQPTKPVTDNTPGWFDKDLNKKEMTKEEENELKKLLANL